MDIKLLEKPSGHRFNTDQLLKRSVGKLCGLSMDIGYISPNSTDPRILTSGVNLTGVHHLLGQPDPGRGAYHVGGIGILPNEAMIKSVAESVERYCQLTAMRNLSEKLPSQFASYNAMLSRHEPVVSDKMLRFFTTEQLNREDFVFTNFNPDLPLQWMKVKSLISGQDIWCPTQLLFVGYICQHERGEPFLNTAVTTGTAAHISYPMALRGALLEIIQLDSTMGHWYSNSTAYEIKHDTRTAALKRLIDRHSRSKRLSPVFYWLPNPDFKVFSIACVFKSDSVTVTPRVAVGLGIDSNLSQAMYKAYLEAYSVVGLTRMVLFKQTYIQGIEDEMFDTKTMFDLNKNVGWYARGRGEERFRQRFCSSPALYANEIPTDEDYDSVEDQLKQLIKIFKDTDKELVYVDLTSTEASSLGLVVPRLWSPSTLPLCLPSAPFSAHPRFLAYGGAAHDDPHPYP